jgi:plastocyanin
MERTAKSIGKTNVSGGLTAMRANYLLAGLAVVVAACGKKGGDAAVDTTAMTNTPPAATTPAAGTTHDVNMVVDGSTYKFEPAMLTIKAGDVVNFHNVSGGPHNVQFYADSIPAGAAAALDAGMADKTGSLAGPLLTDANQVYSVSFAGAPTGEYKYYCLPHQAMNMHGAITVQ